MERIRVAKPDDQELVATVYEHGQGHVFRWWENLNEEQRDRLLGQLRQIDFGELDELAEKYVLVEDVRFKGELSPATVTTVPATDEQKKARADARAAGEELLAAGKVCAFTVAGGQGTRLGFDGPKGAYKITPVRNKPLFQLFAERIVATGNRYGKAINWFIMVSEANKDQTRAFFEENDYFGMAPIQVRMFTQRMIPALDRNGKLILDAADHVFTNPNGHGGSLLALKDDGSINQMRMRGIEQIFYFQIDNVLCRVLDPVFIGYHHLAGAQMSTKVVRKTEPTEKVGLIGYVNGKLGCIEYSDISDEEAARRNPDGSLVFSAGNLAMHMLRVDFVDDITRDGFSLPYHKARKKIPCLNDAGEPVAPDEPNGVKFETFVFDALRFADSSVTMEIIRKDEFSPVKNAEGANSPETARRALTEMYARWLEAAGVNVPRDANGLSVHPIEISPLYALDESEAVGKIDKNLTINGPTCIE